MATWKDRFQELSDQQGRAFEDNIPLADPAVRAAGIEKVREIAKEITAFFDRYKNSRCPDHDDDMPGS